MPFRKMRKGRKAPVRRRKLAVRRPVRSNPQPIFTETFTGPVIAPNTGGIFKFNIGSVPQISQYNNLYQKYRILRAQVILVPQYAQQDQNSAEYNAANNTYAHGMGRFVFAVNDSPGLTQPGSEASVLQDNGCKIRAVKTMVKMGCKPVPLYEDANGILMTLKQNWLNFQIPPAPANPDHFGLSYWYTQPFLGATAQANNDLISYVKLTFQLADPR